jgi:hypothetical protein
MPSGRMVRTFDTKRGQMALHVVGMDPEWSAHRWAVTRHQQEIASGIAWGGEDEAMRHAEEYAGNLIKTEA